MTEFLKDYNLNYTNIKCSVIDKKGNHCPEKPTHIIYHDEEQIFLCEMCYKRYLEKNNKSDNKQKEDV